MNISHALAALLAFTMLSTPLHARKPLFDVPAVGEEAALAALDRYGDDMSKVRAVRAFIYGNQRKVATAAAMLERDGWYNVKFYDAERPAYVVATRASTAERDAIMSIGISLREIAAKTGTRLEAFEIPPAVVK